MTVTIRRVMILCASALHAAVLTLMWLQLHTEHLGIAAETEDVQVHPATRTDLESPFRWKLSWEDWRFRRDGALLSFRTDPDDATARSRTWPVQLIHIRTTEHRLDQRRCEDHDDSTADAREFPLRNPWGNSERILEIPVARNLCTHVSMTFDESEPRVDVRGMNAVVRGELDGDRWITGEISLLVDYVLLALALVSTGVLVWVLWPQRPSVTSGN